MDTQKQKQVDSLMDEGFAITESDPDRAIEIGEELKSLRHTSAFEILALAYAEKEDIPKAVEILEEGVTKGPTVWSLWQLLGNYRSDLQRFSDAQDAYRKALSCPDVDVGSVHFNSGIAYLREEKFGDALRVASLIPEGEHDLKKLYLTLDTHIREQDLDKAQEAACRILDADWDDDSPEDLAYAYALMGEMELAKGASYRALEFAWDAIRLRKAEFKAAWLIREINGNQSADAKYFRLLVHGSWMEPLEGDSEAPNFFTSYDVVADSLDEALDLLKQFEPEEVRESLRIEESEVIENRPDDPKGVYKATGYSFYLEDDEE